MKKKVSNIEEISFRTQRPLVAEEVSNFFLDQITDGIYAVDNNGIIRYANPALARFLGYESVESILGRLFFDFIHKDAFSQIQNLFENAMSTGKETNIINPKITLPNGDSAWISVMPRGRHEYNGQVLNFGIIKDLTLLKRTTLALNKTEHFYHSIVDLSPDVIAVIDTEGQILEINQKAIELFGTKKNGEKESATIFEVIIPEFHEKTRKDIQKIMQSGVLEDAEYQISGTNGAIFWGSVSARLIPSSEDETVKNILILIRNIAKRKAKEEQLSNLAALDDLTGLLNRRGFSLAAEQEIKHAFRKQEGMVLLFFDIDDFKAINDKFGHAEGDRAIKEATRALRSIFRESDIVARWGGDEFVVLALDIPEGRVSSLMLRLDRLLQTKYSSQNTQKYKISFSLGTAYYNPKAPVSLGELETKADAMMYKNKQLKKL